MQVGRKIYYKLSDGTVLCDTGERQGAVVETTQDEDFASFSQLSGVDQTAVGVIQLSYGDRADEFANMESMSVDLTTKTLTITQKTTSTTSSDSTDSTTTTDTTTTTSA